eukprot:TRINITY_DN168_c0_g1_i1.p1 TRINITY_DN168_c0_g1~~TRINITY_DN168_c0_g1_i1.p1  ORF type:complete len:342 (+),score=136.15 TRINITY_DN168_c0_g1_i1:33-1028(+)
MGIDDDDDTKTTICGAEDLQDAFTSGVNAEKKSLKLYISDNAPQKQVENDRPDEKEAIKSAIPDYSKPSEEDINAFLSDDLMMDLFSDLLISVFNALKAANYEVSFIECLQGIILSSNEKYKPITSSRFWPYITEELLPKFAAKIEGFVLPMIQMNQCINADMIKQWIPMLITMMKHHSQNMDNMHGFGANPWFGAYGCGRGRGRRGRGRRRGRGHKHWKHGFKGRRGRRGGWKHRGGPWHYPHSQHHNHEFAPQHQQFHDQGFEGFVLYGPPPQANAENDQMEQDVFMYTEELVAIMNMGFGDMAKIKKLLNEHQGNKELVIQTLVNNKE